MEQTQHMISASAADIELLLELMAEYYACDGIRFDARVARAALEALLDDPAAGRVWLVYDDGRAAAGYLVLTFCFSLEFGGRFGLIDELYMRPECRGRGLGRRAIAVAEELALQMGLKAVRLEVEHENRRAQHLYRSIGFSAHQRYLMTRWLHTAEGTPGTRTTENGGADGAKETAD